MLPQACKERVVDGVSIEGELARVGEGDLLLVAERTALELQ